MPLATERVVIDVPDKKPVDMSGWTLGDSAGIKLRFPAGFIAIGPFSVWTRAGKETPIDLYMGYKRSVWNDGDRVVLKNARGETVSEVKL